MALITGRNEIQYQPTNIGSQMIGQATSQTSQAIAGLSQAMQNLGQYSAQQEAQRLDKQAQKAAQEGAMAGTLAQGTGMAAVEATPDMKTKATWLSPEKDTAYSLAYSEAARAQAAKNIATEVNIQSAALAQTWGHDPVKLEQELQALNESIPSQFGLEDTESKYFTKTAVDERLGHYMPQVTAKAQAVAKANALNDGLTVYETEANNVIQNIQSGNIPNTTNSYKSAEAVLNSMVNGGYLTQVDADNQLKSLRKRGSQAVLNSIVTGVDSDNDFNRTSQELELVANQMKHDTSNTPEEVDQWLNQAKQNLAVKRNEFTTTQSVVNVDAYVEDVFNYAEAQRSNANDISVEDLQTNVITPLDEMRNKNQITETQHNKLVRDGIWQTANQDVTGKAQQLVARGELTTESISNRAEELRDHYNSLGYLSPQEVDDLINSQFMGAVKNAHTAAKSMDMLSHYEREVNYAERSGQAMTPSTDSQTRNDVVFMSRLENKSVGDYGTEKAAKTQLNSSEFKEGLRNYIKEPSGIAAVVNYADTTGMIPTPIKNLFGSGINTDNPNTVVPLAKLYSAMSIKNPQLLESMDDDTIRFYGTVSTLVDNGEDPLAAITKAKELRSAKDTPEQQYARDSMRKNAGGDFSKKREAMFNEMLESPSWLSSDVDDESPEARKFEARFNAVYSLEFERNGGNAELAAKVTQVTLSRKYGVSRYNGSTTIMEYPVEKLHGNWAVAQWKEDKAELNSLVDIPAGATDLNIKLLPDLLTGSNKSYAVQYTYTDINGLPVTMYVTDEEGDTIRWLPEQEVEPEPVIDWKALEQGRVSKQQEQPKQFWPNQVKQDTETPAQYWPEQ